MMGPQLQTVDQIVIGRVLNSLPEGLLIAVFAWVMLRVLPRQNSHTRFAVWFVALLAVAALPVAGVPLISGVTGGSSFVTGDSSRPLITVSGPWGLILFLGWVVAACVAMVRLASGIWRLRALRMSCRAIEANGLDPAIQKALAGFSSSRSVTLATSEQVSVPAAVGFFKPLILLPAWTLRELTPSELNIILLHEFAHLRRGDAWTNLLQKMVRAVFPFHPAVLWIERRLCLEREMACDDQVLAEVANPRGYATCLIALLEKSVGRRGWVMAQAVVHRAGEASLRIAQILDATRPHTKRVWKPALGLVGAFSVLCLVVVPRAPQFVAFEPNTRVPVAEVRPAVLSQSQIAAVAVVPTALRAISSSEPKKIQLSAARAVARTPGHRSPAPQVIPARLSTNKERGPVDATTARNNHKVIPKETLLIIRTTQQVGPNAWVWSVDVWRLNFVNSDQAGAGKVSAAKKT